MIKTILIALGILSISGSRAGASDIKLGDAAPLFTVKNQEGKDFSLASRKGNWTVLYFYPKAETPGCTKQACAFRDNVKKVRDQGADVFGISTDTVEAQKKFHEHHHLVFDLLADPDAKVTEAYGSKMPLLKMSKRWTFIIDPDLKIRSIDQNVDPAMDPEKVVTKLIELKSPH